VVSTASARNLAFVSELGAEQVFDYQATRFEEKLSEIEATADDRVKQAFFIVEPNHEQLTRIGKLLETRRLQTVVDAVAEKNASSSTIDTYRYDLNNSTIIWHIG
jgi:NADPH:quinone reductase-like Zn-dependent oxidoreductase